MRVKNWRQRCWHNFSQSKAMTSFEGPIKFPTNKNILLIIKVINFQMLHYKINWKSHIQLNHKPSDILTLPSTPNSMWCPTIISRNCLKWWLATTQNVSIISDGWFFDEWNNPAKWLYRVSVGDVCFETWVACIGYVNYFIKSPMWLIPARIMIPY